MDDPKGLEKFRTRTELDVQFADALRVIAKQRSSIEAATKRAELAEALQRRTLRRVELEQERGRKLYAALERAVKILLPYTYRQTFAPEDQRLPGELIEAMTADDAAAHAILNDTETTP